MEPSDNSGRLRVLGEHWVNTTIAAHRILERLPSYGKPGVSEGQLQTDFGQALTRMALSLLRQGEWATCTPPQQLWSRTVLGDEHLHEITRDWAGISQALDNWLLGHGVSAENLTPVREHLTDVVRRGLRREIAVAKNAAQLLTSLFRSTDTTMLGEYEHLLSDAATEFLDGKENPVVSIVCHEALGRITEEFWESLGKLDRSEPLHVILDTNVLVRLLCESSPEHTLFYSVLEELVSDRPTTVHVFTISIRELRGIVRAGEAYLEAAASWPGSAARLSSKQGETYSSFTDNPFVVEYLSSVDCGMPYTCFADRAFRRICATLAEGARTQIDAKSANIPIGRIGHVTLPCKVIVHSGPWPEEGSQVPNTSPYHAMESWPTYAGALRWLLRRKDSAEQAQHDAQLYAEVSRHRRSDGRGHWIVWTIDGWLFEFERCVLKLSQADGRIYRSTRMIQGLLARPPSLSSVQEEALRQLLSWASTRSSLTDRLAAALDLSQGVGRDSYEQGRELLLRAYGDPYGVLGIMQDQELVEAVDTEEPEDTAGEDEQQAAESVSCRRACCGWPKDLERSEPWEGVCQAVPKRHVTELTLHGGPGRYVELSVDWGDYVASHGPLPLTIGRRESVGEGTAGIYPEIQLSVHSVSHFDLPWAVVRPPSELGVPDLRDTRGSARAMLTQHRLTRSQEREAVIVDLRYKSEALAGMLCEAPAGSGEWVVRPDKRSQIQTILQRLWISRDDLEMRLATRTGHVSLSNRWLLLHTGWPELFRPAWPDLSNPGFECWHAWSLHPYLDQVCVEWLLEQGIYGLATDTSMVDCPAYVLPRSAELLSDLSDAVNFLKQARSVSRGMPHLPTHQPVHTRILLHNKPMLESLYVDSAVITTECQIYARSGRMIVPLFTAGLGMPYMDDGALAKVFLRLKHV